MRTFADGWGSGRERTGLVATRRRTTWTSDQREALRATFDQHAEAYDRSRPVAPDDVFDEALRLTSLAPGSIVLEIGPGTGQATRQLAARGLQVVAVELGPQLAERARANLAGFPHVDIVTASFETWDPVL
jgi:protein-L-isoaspartate O-methyltransferase